MAVILTILITIGFILINEYINQFNEYLEVEFCTNLYEPLHFILIGISELTGFFAFLSRADLRIDNFVVLLIISIAFAIGALVLMIKKTNATVGIVVFLIDSVLVLATLAVIVLVISSIFNLFDNKRNKKY